jgi:hypothetical protein
MVERYRSYEPDITRLEQDISGTLRRRSYAFGRTAAELASHDSDSVPLFLSDPESEPDPIQFEYVGRLQEPRRLSISAKILVATVAASAVAVIFAWFSSDATRDALESAKTSIASVLPVPSAAAQPDPTAQLTPQDVQLKEPARLVTAGDQAAGAMRPPQRQVAALPSREEISTAYQNAVQNRTVAAPVPAASEAIAAVAPIAVAPPPAPAPLVRRMEAAELANLMQRAKSFLVAGDLPAARLLLERAADAQDADAALLLAQTYDPAVVGVQDVRNIMADPAKARNWYQKAAQFGSADAQRRLAQLPN